MEILIGWLIFSAAIGWAAGQRGRSPANWFLISLLISPLVAVVVLLLAGRGAGSSGASTLQGSGPEIKNHLSEEDWAYAQKWKAEQKARERERRGSELTGGQGSAPPLPIPGAWLGPPPPQGIRVPAPAAAGEQAPLSDLGKEEWSVAVNGEVIGSLNLAGLHHSLTAGTLSMEDFFYDEMRGEWLPLGQHPGLANGGA